MSRRRVHVPALYDSVIERNFKKSRYCSISVSKCFLVRQDGVPAPISISRDPRPYSPYGLCAAGETPRDDGDLGISIQLRLDGYALAPLQWFRERGIDPVAMRDESREYRETFFSVARRWVRHLPETFWRVRNLGKRRVVDVERV